MIARVKKSVNHLRTVASMRETGREQQQQEVHLPSDSTVVTFAFGPVGHCFLCCNQFLSAVMWNLRFPLFWSYMWFTTLKTRPVNIDRKQTCSSMPDLLTHFTSPDAGSQAVFLKTQKLRNREKTWGKNGGTRKKCNYRLLFINLYSPNRHSAQNSKR